MKSYYVTENLGEPGFQVQETGDRNLISVDSNGYAFVEKNDKIFGRYRNDLSNKYLPTDKLHEQCVVMLDNREKLNDQQIQTCEHLTNAVYAFDPQLNYRIGTNKQSRKQFLFQNFKNTYIRCCNTMEGSHSETYLLQCQSVFEEIQL